MDVDMTITMIMNTMTLKKLPISRNKVISIRKVNTSDAVQSKDNDIALKNITVEQEFVYFLILWQLQCQ